MKTHCRSGKPGFTLVEMMAVMVIIVILAALAVVGMDHAAHKQASARASVQFALLTKGLEEYKLDMGNFPVSANTADGLNQSDKCLYQALFREGYDYTSSATPPVTWAKATRIYVPELDPTSSKLGWVTPVTGSSAVPPAGTKVMDPWGVEYRYRSAKNASGTPNSSTINPEFDLWSSGADGKSFPGTPSSPLNRDDLRNFSPRSPLPALSQPIADILTGNPVISR